MTPLVEVEGLEKYFPVRRGLLGRTIGHVQAVDGVSFTLHESETLGLVGETGCGKTTTGRAILRLIEPTRGAVRMGGRDFLKLRGEELRHARKDLQIIFQDPYGSLNPRMTIGAIVGEGLQVHGMGSRAERIESVKEALVRVGLDPGYVNRYPHEFSGGQRQRIGIARALVLRPKFIVCDEPVSALDVSIQSQIINLLMDLRREFGIAYLFIAHDLSVVRYISDRVAVMYLGKIVELASSDDLYRRPLHPYTQALLAAVPVPDPRARKERQLLAGDVPSPFRPPAGCRFHPRCPLAKDVCKQAAPRELNLDGHLVWCHVVEEQMAGKKA